MATEASKKNHLDSIQRLSNLVCQSLINRPSSTLGVYERGYSRWGVAAHQASASEGGNNLYIELQKVFLLAKVPIQVRVGTLAPQYI